MHPLLRSLITVSAASVALAACTDRPSSEPTAPGQLRPSFSLDGLATACNINSLRDNSKIVFVKNNDAIYKIINDLSKLTAGSPAATDKVFDGVARIAVVRLTNLQNTGTAVPEAFDDLVKGFFGCAEASVRTDVPAVDFAPFALTAGYLFEVLGPNLAGYQRGNSSPYWGMEVGAANKRFLAYGTPDATLLANSGRIGSAIDLHTIPVVADGGLDISANVGLCEIPGTPGSDPGGRRANHAGTFGSYVALNCTRGAAAGTAVAQGTSFDLRTLAVRAVDFFAPRPLHAATAFFAGSVGLGAEGVSPFAVYDLSQVVLGSLGTIANGNNKSFLTVVNSVPTYGNTVVVRATNNGPDNAPLVGVPIQMAIQGNSSSIAFFRVGADTVPTVTRTTNTDGYAIFHDVVLIKAGGYTLNFRVFFDDQNIADVVGPILVSNPFQIQNK
jgi:hypothetical protein